MDWIKALPVYITIPIGIVILVVAVILVFKAFGEGREISFWPPKIGPKPEATTTPNQTSQSVPTSSPPSLSVATSPSPDISHIPSQELSPPLRKFDVKRRIAEGDYYDFDFPRWDVGDQQTMRIKILAIKTIMVYGSETKQTYAAHLKIEFSSFAPHLTLQPGRNAEKLNDEEFIISDDPHPSSTTGLHAFWIGTNRVVLFHLNIDHINPHARQVDVEFSYVY